MIPPPLGGSRGWIVAEAAVGPGEFCSLFMK